MLVQKCDKVSIILSVSIYAIHLLFEALRALQFTSSMRNSMVTSLQLHKFKKQFKQYNINTLYYHQLCLPISIQSNIIFNRRFAPTRPPVHWSGIHSTTGYGPVCPQAFPDISNASVSIKKMPLRRLQYLRKIQPKLIHESEDCLYLNIYVPKGGKLILYFYCKLLKALTISYMNSNKKLIRHIHICMDLCIYKSHFILIQCGVT